MNEQIKFARWILIHTDEVNHTAGVCRRYQNKLYTIDEIFDIYTNIQSKSENAELTPHIEYHRNGNVYIKGQKNSKGQQEGLWELFDFNGNIHWRIPFKEGKEDGIWGWFYENGNIRWRAPYVGGKMDGIVEEFYENGNIRWRAPYVEDKEDGIAEEFDEQGNITETTLWTNGELIEETEPELTPRIEYYSNGNVWIKGQKNSKGQHEGIWEYFYENGNIRMRIPYKEGKEDGIVEWFYENGNIYWRISYKEDKLDGIKEEFDEQGNITETRVWKDGELIEETKH